jgi:DNA-binding SARP family transcriptional activator
VSNDLSTDWLQQSLLRLSPNVFFHNIWIDFVSTNVSFAPELIEELNQTAERLVVGEDLISACQTWLICAVLESQLGDYPAALAFVEKTAEFAQEHHLPQINSWANWGASALCAREGHWQQAVTYLQRLQRILNQQDDWMLASVINILETSLSRLDATKPTPSTLSIGNSQLDIAFEQLLHWEEPIHTLLSDSSKSDDGRSSSWRSFWQTVTGFFRGKTDSQPPGSTVIPLDVLPTIRPHERPPPSLAPPQLKAPEQPKADESSIPVRATVTDASPSAEGMTQLEKRPFTYPNTATKRHPSLPIERETQTKTEPVIAPKHNTPSLTVYCLGLFRVYQDEKPIEQWPSGKGKLIFKYLLTHRQQPIGKEVLMDQFWPEATPDAARNNLNVAIYGLRQALRNGYEQFSHVLFQDDHYLLNPELPIWVDYEAFLELWQTAQIHEKQGDWSQAIRDYNAAASLYQGEFLAEDRYEEWLLPQRQQIEDAYLNLLDKLSHYHFQNEGYAACIEACRHILAVEACRESTHRRLMRCYCRQGQYYLGLRQYHQCVEALYNELEVTPSPQTTHLYEQIRHHEPV